MKLAVAIAIIAIAVAGCGSTVGPNQPVHRTTAPVSAPSPTEILRKVPGIRLSGSVPGPDINGILYQSGTVGADSVTVWSGRPADIKATEGGTSFLSAAGGTVYYVEGSDFILQYVTPGNVTKPRIPANRMARLVEGKVAYFP